MKSTIHSIFIATLTATAVAQDKPQAVTLPTQTGSGKVTRVFVYDHKNDKIYEWKGDSNDASGLYSQLYPNTHGSNLIAVSGKVKFKKGDRVALWAVDANRSRLKLTVKGSEKAPEAGSDLAVLQKLTDALAAGTFALDPLLSSAGASAVGEAQSVPGKTTSLACLEKKLQLMTKRSSA